MRRNALLGVAATIFVLALGFTGWKFYFVQSESDQSEDLQQLAEQAKPYAQGIADFFQGISSDLNSYAESEDIKTIFLSDDDMQLQQQEVADASRFPSALKLRLIRPGQYRLDNASTPPLGYGSMDILRRAEQSSSTIAAEALLFGNDNQHIVLVSRVKNQSDQLIGLVHLSLDVNLFQNALNQLNAGNAYIEIRQSAAGTPLVLGSHGDPTIKNGGSGTTSIAGTRWTLAYWSQANEISTGFMSNGSGTSMNILIVLALLVICTIIFLSFRKRGKNDVVDKPEISYAGAIKAIMDGAHPGMEKLISHMPKRDGPVAVAASAAGDEISTAMEGEDITSFANDEDINSASAASADVFDITQPDEAPEEKKNEKIAVSDTPPETEDDATEVAEVIFRKYDIRGVVGETLTPEIVKKIGLAIGSEAHDADLKSIVVGRDGRHSSPDLSNSLIKGLMAAGIDVIDIGVAPTPVLYFAAHHLKTTSGVMVTGSHNGPEYNGLKVVLGGNTLSEDGIKKLYERINSSEYSSGSGNLSTAEVIPDYIRRITEDIPVALGSSYKLVIDCGNGAASVVASQLFRAIGHDVIELFCELDGSFPNHHPDPSQPENLQPLIDKIKDEQADLGFAFDGDGDRLGVVDGNGTILWPDRQMMVFARDVLSRNQGANIIFDVKCSSHLKKIIEENGGKALMWKTGHSLIKAKMKEVKAPLAGEMSGHIFFAERWYGFDDALYSGARLLEILSNAKTKPADFFAELPDGVSTPELRIDLPESEHPDFMKKLEEKIAFEDAEIITIDGFRVEFSDGWGLVRPSNTTPCLVVRFEANNQDSLSRIQGLFRELLLSINPDLSLPF